MIKKICIFLFIILTVLSCTSRKGKVFTIGFSQCIGDDAWRKQMINEMKIEASFYDNVNLIVEDAKGNSELQVKQIQGLLNKKVDLLIISPNESKPITAIAQKAYKQGIPTILIDRKIDSDEYSVFIGADNYAIGKFAAIFLGNSTHEKMNVLEVWGLEGSSPARERHKGFIDNISHFPNFNLTGKVSGRWLKGDAFEQVKSFKHLDQIQVIFAHNDEMALGAYEACKRLKMNTKNMTFLGVDALQGNKGGIQAVINHKLTATMLYPTGGGKAIQVALQILEHKDFKKEYLLNTALVDSLNAQILQLQSVQINDYLGKIENQQFKLKSLDNKYNNQQTLLYFTIILMGLAFFLAIMLFFAYNHTKRILVELKIKNQKIDQQREKLSQQREQLVIMNEKIEEVTAQKLRFFTNVSHELRTPLSLLISPLEKLLEINKYPEMTRELVVMKNNTERLLRLISQLLDFRKIEDEMMKLYVQQVNIISLIKNIKAAFNYQAHIKEINYQLTIPENEIDIFCDEDKMEKVFLNLISNAFKFTKKGGTIRIEVTERNNEVQISVLDSGKGIDKEQLTKIFDRFYQGTGDYSSGTGIGLNLSKEYVELHNGRIIAESQPEIGSKFTVLLKKGKEHLEKEYISFIPDSVSNSKKIGNGYLMPEGSEPLVSINEGDYEYNLLVVEDDDDMREYLKTQFKKDYTVFVATNGNEAYQMLKDVEINLIVCDVMMPEMDGFEFCRIVKNDLAFSHIPVILLTALSGEDQLIKGLTIGADDYLYKPFNYKHLQLKVRNLLQLKKKYRDSFKSQFLGSYNETELDSADKKFIGKVTKVLDKYIKDSEISIEKISADLGISRIHLYRKIKDITGYSPSEFFKSYKIKKSLPLLLAKNLNISEIAYQCGFSSPAYYSKCFKEILNISPTEYKLSNTK